MKTVLIINHRIKACGVQSFGKRVYELANRSTQVRYLYAEIEFPHEYIAVARDYAPDFILYNWHRGTMPWLSETLVKMFPNIKHYFMYHEEFTREFYDKYLFFGDYDFNGGDRFGAKKTLLPRPLLDYSGGYPVNTVPTIGSFGFGFWQKGYHTLTRLVNDTFDKAVLNFHMPYSHFGDPLHKQGNEVEDTCRKANTNPGITLNITHDFRDDAGILSFLAGNDINVFMYSENGEGISSVIDYALSVKRPIAISDSKMFRHVLNDDISLSKNSILDVLNKGTAPLETFYTNWSTEKFVEELDKEFV
jgi:hypothetical protein